MWRTEVIDNNSSQYGDKTLQRENISQKMVLFTEQHLLNLKNKTKGKSFNRRINFTNFAFSLFTKHVFLFCSDLIPMRIDFLFVKACRPSKRESILSQLALSFSNFYKSNLSGHDKYTAITRKVTKCKKTLGSF